MTQSEKTTSIELNLYELKMIKLFLPDDPCSNQVCRLLDKIDEKIIELEAMTKEKLKELVAENIFKKFGIKIMNPWLINVDEIGLIQVYKDLFDGNDYIDLALKPEDKSSRFFRMLPDFDVEEVFPKVVITRTVEWHNRLD